MVGMHGQKGGIAGLGGQANGGQFAAGRIKPPCIDAFALASRIGAYVGGDVLRIAGGDGANQRHGSDQDSFHGSHLGRV